MGKLGNVLDQIGSGTPANIAIGKLHQGAGSSGSNSSASAAKQGLAGASTGDPKSKLKEAEVQKAAYMTVLAQALSKASDNLVFNLDSQIAEVVVRLNKLRDGKADLGTLAGLIGKDGQLDKELADIQKSLGDGVKSGLNKMKHP